MNDIAARVAQRHLQMAMASNINRVRVIVPDGGEITGHDIQRMFRVHGIRLHCIELHAGPIHKVVGWTGRDADGIESEVKCGRV